MMQQNWQRSKGQGLTYTIRYGMGQYLILRDGELKRSLPDAFIASIDPDEATPELMLSLAIADIESLIGMEE